MHQRTCGDHQQPLWVRLRSIGACFVGGVALVEVVHTDNAYEGPEWKRAQAVLEFAAFGAPDPWAKAHIELGDFHSTLTCGNEVPYFVQKNRDNETSHEHQCPWIRYTQPNEKTHQHNCAEHCRTLLTRAFWPIDGVATGNNFISKLLIEIAQLATTFSAAVRAALSASKMSSTTCAPAPS